MDGKLDSMHLEIQSHISSAAVLSHDVPSSDIGFIKQIWTLLEGHVSLLRPTSTWSPSWKKLG